MPKKEKKITFKRSSLVGHLSPEYLCSLLQQVRLKGLSSSSWEALPGVSPNFIFFPIYHLGRRKSTPEVLHQHQHVHGTVLAKPPPSTPISLLTLSRREPPQFCDFLNSRLSNYFSSGPLFRPVLYFWDDPCCTALVSCKPPASLPFLWRLNPSLPLIQHRIQPYLLCQSDSPCISVGG